MQTNKHIPLKNVAIYKVSLFMNTLSHIWISLIICIDKDFYKQFIDTKWTLNLFQWKHTKASSDSELNKRKNKNKYFKEAKLTPVLIIMLLKIVYIFQLYQYNNYIHIYYKT